MIVFFFFFDFFLRSTPQLSRLDMILAECKRECNQNGFVKSSAIKNASEQFEVDLVNSPNAGKHRPGKLRIQTLFTQCNAWQSI